MADPADDRESDEGLVQIQDDEIPENWNRRELSTDDNSIARLNETFDIFVYAVIDQSPAARYASEMQRARLCSVSVCVCVSVSVRDVVWCVCVSV